MQRFDGGVQSAEPRAPREREGKTLTAVPDAHFLRRCAWEIAARQAEASHTCTESYVTLAAVSPSEGFATWRIPTVWVEKTAARRGDAWHGARLVLRLYDVSYVLFNGLNAHRVRDFPLDGLTGELFVRQPLAGTFQLAEIGFLLRTGEFVPAARSGTAQFPLGAVSSNQDHSALYVDDRLVPEPVPSPWESEAYLRERRKPRLRPNLRVAMLALEAKETGHEGRAATFVSHLAAELGAQGQDVHLFVPAWDGFREERAVAGVSFHPLAFTAADGPLAAALAFARAVEARLRDLPPFDLFHAQEWMTAMVPWLGTRPTILGLTSIEHTRRNGSEPTRLSLEIEKLEREVAHAVECIIVPEWLRPRAVEQLGVDGARVHVFPVEGRPLDEWERPLDYGQVKAEIGLGPFDRLLLFVGPLEYGAGPDLIIEALPPVLASTPGARAVFVGCGGLYDYLAHRAHQLGAGHAVRFLGHVDGSRLTRLLRASEALVLPARHRIEHDESLVWLARRAGRAVVTTHGGPAHRVTHEHDGLVAYDNPPSIVWAMSRLLGDPQHAERMGRNGKQHGEGASWSSVARYYAELCALSFSELTEDPSQGRTT